MSECTRTRAPVLPHSNRFSDLVEIANDLIAHVIESEQLHYFLFVCSGKNRNDGNSEWEEKEEIRRGRERGRLKVEK